MNKSGANVRTFDFIDTDKLCEEYVKGVISLKELAFQLSIANFTFSKERLDKLKTRAFEATPTEIAAQALIKQGLMYEVNNG
ncbi:hypothetical protein [Liquorilactobacillus hordei]|nr:hypothetical protein [Liquorilactobacillus hordei]